MSEPTLTPEVTIRHPRLIAYQQLIAVIRRFQQQSPNVTVWTDFLDRLPLTMGESSAERSVYYSVSDAVFEAFSKAVDGLTDLVKRRADPQYDQEKKSVLLPDERSRVVLRPWTFCPRTIPEQSPLRPVVRTGLLQCADLDGGLLESWLTSSAGGMGLFKLTQSLVAKSLAVSRNQLDFSGIALLSHFALMNTLLVAKERVKQASLKNLTYARLERAVGLALHACFSQAVGMAQDNEPPPPPGTREYTDQLIITVSMTPLGFLAIRRTELDTDINPYGLSAAVEENLMPLYQSILEKGNQPQMLLEELKRAVFGQSDLYESMLRSAICEGFRRLALAHLVQAQDPEREADKLLVQAFAHNDALQALLEDSASASLLLSDLSDRFKNRYRSSPPPEDSSKLLGYLKLVCDIGPPWKKPSALDAAYLQAMLERFILRRLDEYATAHIDRARGRLIDRRGSIPTSGLIREYEAGRLYRISNDEQPMIKARVIAEEAQLFVDLKGYTRRTARAKELVMADFMKKEFYLPILQAAKQHHADASLVRPEESVRLVNLLGDAAVFSGNVVSLVALSFDTQRIFKDYAEKLQSFMPKEDDGSFGFVNRQVQGRREEISAAVLNLNGRLQYLKKEVYWRSALSLADMEKQLEKDFEEQFDQLLLRYQATQAQAQKAQDPDEKTSLNQACRDMRDAHARLKLDRKETQKRLADLDDQERLRQLSDLLSRKLLKEVREIEDRIRVLQEEDRALLDVMEDERKERLGSGLEAGLFISYGRSPEVIEIDDDAWGELRVSVSERINEAARGTARNMTVKRHFDDMLADARAERGDNRLEHPFRVYIFHSRAFELTPAMTRLWNKVIEERDKEQLEKFVASLNDQIQVQYQMGDERIHGPQPHAMNDIYNLGEAISEQALDAYLQKTRSTHFFFRVQVRPAELAPEIRERFFFPDEVLTLVLGRRLSDDEGGEVFRYVGQVLFRGFEVTQPTRVYEIMRTSSPFMRLLMRHHLEDWFKAAHQNPECKLSGLYASESAAQA